MFTIIFPFADSTPNVWPELVNQWASTSETVVDPLLNLYHISFKSGIQWLKCKLFTRPFENK